MIHELREQRKEHAAIHEVLHAGCLRGVNHSDAHRGLLRVKRRTIVEHDVDAVQRGTERRLFEVVGDDDGGGVDAVFLLRLLSG